MAEKQQDEVSVREINRVRRTAGMVRADKRKTEELREEDGMKERSCS